MTIRHIKRVITIGFIVSFFIEFGPTIAFFAASQYAGFFTGAAALVFTTVLSLLWAVLRDKRIAVFSLVTSTFVLFFGIMTLVRHDPSWLYLEYTAYNGIFGMVLLAGFVRGRGLLKEFFGSMFLLEERGWLLLSLRWSIVFIVTAIGNEIAWRFYGWDFWVTYRFSTAILQAIFGFSQLFLARTYRLSEANEWGLRK